MIRKLLLLASAVVAAGLAVAAQQRTPAIPSAGETIEVAIVNLDVFVTDRKGRRVHGLTKDDFEIRENGRLQEITHFAEYGSTATTEARATVESPAAADVPRRPRTLAIFIERQALIPIRRDEFFGALRSFVDSALEPGDRALVVTWHRGSLRIRQPLTTDRAAIQATIDAIAKETRPLLIDDARHAQAEAELAAEPDPATGEMTLSQDDRLLIGAPCASHAMREIRAKGRALTSILNSLAGIEGRKALLMATRRFGIFAGVDCFGGQIPAEEMSRYDTDEIRSQVIDAANANGVTIYAVHPETIEPDIPGADQRAPRALGQSDASPAVVLNESQALDEIATRTGGLSTWGREVVRLLPRIDGDLDAYYSLAYRARGGNVDRVRKISVTTKRRDLTVRTRTQVVEKSDTTRMKDRVVTALSYAVDRGALPIGVATGELRKSGRNRYILPVIVQVPIGPLTLVPQGSEERGAFSVFVAAGDGRVLFSGVTHKTQPLAIPARDVERAKKSHVTYDLELMLDGAATVVAVGVYDEVGREYGLRRVRVAADRR